MTRSRNTATAWTGITAYLFAIGCATAAYLISDYGDTPPRPPRPPIPPPESIRPVPPPPSGNPASDLLRRIEVGQPYRYRGLTVFPLVASRARTRSDIRTLDEASRNGWLTLREEGDGVVAEVMVRNESSHVVLLTGGEILAGGRQNRVVREDVLLAPHSDFIAVPVYCVEKDRWSGRTDRFESPSSMVHQELRRSAATGESQGEIWREVENKAGRLGVPSRTRNYQDIYEDEGVRRRADDCARYFRDVCRPDTVGAVAVAGGRILSCDLCGDPDLFARLWPKLCRSYALEELSDAGRDGTVDRRDVERFLGDAARADFDSSSTPGAGRMFRFRGAISGTALLWDDEVAHSCLFPAAVFRPMERRLEGRE